MKICCMADIHGNLIDIQPCDMVIIAGDICPAYNHNIYFQANWLNSVFSEYINILPAKHKIVIAGNHDFIFEKKPELVNTRKYIYLKDSEAIIEGLKIWGTPWQPYFFDWAFNLYEPDLIKKWELIPNDTNILVVHGPPYGLGDLAPRQVIQPENEEKWVDGEHTGSPGLLERIKKVRPALAVYGHIHEGYGKWKEPGLETVCVNAAIGYRGEHKPIYIDLQLFPKACGVSD